MVFEPFTATAVLLSGDIHEKRDFIGIVLIGICALYRDRVFICKKNTIQTLVIACLRQQFFLCLSYVWQQSILPKLTNILKILITQKPAIQYCNAAVVLSRIKGTVRVENVRLVQTFVLIIFIEKKILQIEYAKKGLLDKTENKELNNIITKLVKLFKFNDELRIIMLISM